MKKIFLIPLCFCSTTIFSQNTETLELLFHWNDETIAGTTAYNNAYNEIWGLVINEREFAVIGSTAGTHIFDVTDAQNSIQVQFIPGAAVGVSIIHRDYHDHNGFLYAVSDEGNSSLQIIDINNLPEEAIIVYDSNELIKTSHNIFIDEKVDIMYACNVRTATSSWNSTSLAIFDIENPLNPVHLLDFEVPGTNSGVHDMWVKNDTAFLNNGGDGLYVVDFSNLESPQILGSLTDYPDKGYNHSGWPTSDMNSYVLADENWGYDLKVLDISSLSDINVQSTLSSEIHENSIAHNPLIKGNYLYVSSYHDGLQVYNIIDPENPFKVASFSTYLLDDHDSYRGAWGVYPFLPSGNILVSDMQYGLYVLKGIGFETVDQSELKFSKISIHPNPSSGLVKIETPSNETLSEVCIYNMKGEKVYQKQFNEPIQTIDLGYLGKGLYLLKAMGNNIVCHQKIIIK